MDGMNNETLNNEAVNTEPVNSEPVYTEPVNSEPVYTEPNYGYNATYQQDYSYQEQPAYQQPQPNLQGFQQQVAKCPAKEIACLVCGISSLVWSVLGTLLGCFPVYGIIFAVIWGGFGIGFGIAANILNKKVHEQADEFTNKIEIGKKLATAGIIVGAIGMVLSIIATIVIIAVWGAAAATSIFSTMQNSGGGNITF